METNAADQSGERILERRGAETEKRGTKREERSGVIRSKRSEKSRAEQCRTSRAKRSEKINSEKAECTIRRMTCRWHTGAGRQQMIETMAEY